MHGAAYEYRILRPTPVAFWVKVVVGADEALTDALADRIRKAVVDDFSGRGAHSGNPRVGLADTVYASRFYCSIVHVPVQRMVTLTIALGDSPDSLSFGDVLDVRGDQEPAMTAENVIVEQAS
jgi:hypothetical protein